MNHVFIIGSKGIPAAYGGFESFVDKLTAERKSNTIQYLSLIHISQSEVYVIPDKSQVYYNFNGAQRNYQNASDRHLLYGSFVETIKADMISLHTENEGGCCRMS